MDVLKPTAAGSASCPGAKPGEAAGNGLNISGGVWHEVTESGGGGSPAPGGEHTHGKRLAPVIQTALFFS